MSDQIDDDTTMPPLLAFLRRLREVYIEQSDRPMVEAAREFDAGIQPLAQAYAEQIRQEQVANQPSKAEMLMELVLEAEQVVALVPPRLRRYREQLAAEGLDKTVVAPVPASGQPAPEPGAEGGREGLPGINLADQAALEFHSQLLSLAFAIAQDEVSQRMERRAQQAGDRP